MSIGRPGTSWRDLFLNRINPDFKLRFDEPIMVNGERVVAPPAEVFERGSQQWKFTLVGQFLGISPSFSAIKRMVEQQWKPFGPVRISTTDKGVVLFRLPSKESCNCVLERLWSLDNKPLILKRWVSGMVLEAFRTEEFPIWVRLKDVPVDLWNIEGLGYVVSGVGTPLQTER